MMTSYKMMIGQHYNWINFSTNRIFLLIWVLGRAWIVRISKEKKFLIGINIYSESIMWKDIIPGAQHILSSLISIINLENIIILNLHMRSIICNTTWEMCFRTTSLLRSTLLIPPYSLQFLWWWEFREHFPLWLERKGNNRTRLCFRQTETDSSLSCCGSFLFPSPQSLPLSQNHLLVAAGIFGSWDHSSVTSYSFFFSHLTVKPWNLS